MESVFGFQDFCFSRNKNPGLSKCTNSPPRVTLFKGYTELSSDVAVVLLSNFTISIVLSGLVRSTHQADMAFAPSFVQNAKSCATTREAVVILCKLKKTRGQFGLCRCDAVSLSPSFITEALLWKL